MSILGQLYFRSDSHTINGLNADKLDATNTASTSLINNGGSGVSGDLAVAINLNVRVRHSDTSETSLGTGVGEVSRAGGSGAYDAPISSTWDCPGSSLVSTDAIAIKANLYIGGVLRSTQEFITVQLGYTSLEASTWDFSLHLFRSYFGGSTFGGFYWGNTTYVSYLDNSLVNASNNLVSSVNVFYTPSQRNIISRVYTPKIITWGEETPSSPRVAKSWQVWANENGDPITVIGDTDWGKARIPSGGYIVSDVRQLSSGTKRIAISTNNYEAGSGTPTLYYRTSSTKFNQTDGSPSWTEYTGGQTTTDNYIQVRIG